MGNELTYLYFEEHLNFPLVRKVVTDRARIRQIRNHFNSSRYDELAAL